MFGTAFANSLLEWIYRGAAAPTLSADLSFSLHTADPGGTGANECTGGSYARATLTRAPGNWDAAASKATQNAAAITFPSPTASWGTATHMGIWSGTDFVKGVALTASKSINNGDPAPSFPIGALDPSLV